MTKEQDRILSYKLATILRDGDLDNVSGGSSATQTMGTQRIINTQGGDTTIHFDNLDGI